MLKKTQRKPSRMRVAAVNDISSESDNAEEKETKVVASTQVVRISSL